MICSVLISTWSKSWAPAGVTLATSLVSLLTGIPVPPELAMTGEVTLRGKVLPVGGIKEKVIAAKSAGIKRVILPSKNEKDLEDVTEPVRKALSFDFVDEVEHPIYGSHPRLGPLVHFSRTPGVSRAGCTIGQHTRSVLEEIGYSNDRIEALAAAEKIRLG